MISSKNRRVGSIYLVGQLSEQASRRSFGEPAQKAGIVLRASARQSLGTQANEFDLRLPLGGVWRFAQVRLRLSPASRRRRSRRPIRTSTRTYPPNESLFIGVFFRGDFRRFRAVSLNLLPLTARWRKQQRQPMTMNMGDKWPRNTPSDQEKCLSRYRQVVVPAPSAADVKWQPAVAVDTLPLT